MVRPTETRQHMRDRDQLSDDGPKPGTSKSLAASPGEVLLWLIDTTATGDQLAAAMAALTDAERIDMERLAIPHRRRFAICRLAIRRLIAHQLAIAPEEVAIVRAPGGRPQLDPRHRSSLSFSLSYSGERVLIAIADGLIVGVDIERIRPIAEVEAIVRSRFSVAEVEVWSRLAPDARLPAFYEAWTRKEAVFKAMGVGLTLPLDRLTVTFGPEVVARVAEVDGREARHWRLIDVRDFPEHKAALALTPADAAWLMEGEPVLRRLPDWCPAAQIASRIE